MATLAGGGADRIALANEPPFRLGILEVIPAWRQVRTGGESRTLEPRVMQVLVALAQADGGIVGRDELIARCWDGRIVGENAINRVISLLRALAGETGAFEIETITKVGYRLKTSDHPPPPLAPSDPPSRHRVLRRTALASIGAVLAGGAAYLVWPDSLSPRRREAERYFRAGMDSERLGDAGVNQALAYYQKAVRADPNYAEAWGAVARALLSIADGRGDSIELIALRLEEASRRALQLDPRNRDALLAQVMVKPSFRNWAELERTARHALVLRPDLDLVRAQLAQSLANTGRIREAVALVEPVIARQPLWPGIGAHFAWLLWQVGRTSDARAAFDRIYRAWPDHAMVWTYRIMFLTFSGAIGDALAMTQGDRMRAAVGGPLPAPIAALCVQALSTGATDLDRRKALSAIRAARKAGDMASFVSINYVVQLGDLALAFEQLYGYLLGKRDPLTGERQPLPPYADRWTDFMFAIPTAPMRADPRFPKLTAAVGLDDYWQTTGTRPDYRAI
jgi:DNA-binding winged helix-turn-helix (wHTH) protein/tetratricopeptide (TPR) repeat protein